MKKRVAPTASWSGPWLSHFFKRHAADDAGQAVPGREFLERCPTNVQAKLVAILHAVAEAPPPMFSGGGKWEAMHDDMKGFYEARADGKDREHFRLFCLLERDGARVGLGGPSIVIITGARKAFRTTLSSADYAAVRALGDEYLRRTPRSVAR